MSDMTYRVSTDGNPAAFPIGNAAWLPTIKLTDGLPGNTSTHEGMSQTGGTSGVATKTQFVHGLLDLCAVTALTDYDFTQEVIWSVTFGTATRQNSWILYGWNGSSWDTLDSFSGSGTGPTFSHRYQASSLTGSYRYVQVVIGFSLTTSTATQYNINTFLSDYSINGIRDNSGCSVTPPCLPADILVPQGRLRAHVPTYNNPPSIITPGVQTWDVIFHGVVIADSTTPNGWAAAFDGTDLYIRPPLGATVDTCYEVRYSTG